MARKWCVIDAEGSRDNLHGVAFYADTVQTYITDHAEIRRTLESMARSGYTFVAHNAAYDLPVIFWTLDMPMRAVYYDSHFNRGQWRYHPKRPLCELWDSFNLSGNISVESLGRALHCEKLPTPQVLLGRDPDRYAWFCDLHGKGECIECYAVRDAEIVYRYMQSLTLVISSWGVKPAARIAGIAQSVWRALDTPDPIRLTDARIRHLGRKAYFGGRVECFKLGHISPLYTADVTSMYPSVMLNANFADPSTMAYVRGISPDSLPLEYDGVADCLVHAPAHVLPTLPNSYKGQRVFAIGVQRGCWTHYELRYAQSIGYRILRVYAAAWGTRSLSPFTNFIGGLWELRQTWKRESDPREQTVKVLLNSCYGRLGMRGDLTQETIEPWDEEKTMDDYMRIAARRGISRRKRPDGTLVPVPLPQPDVIHGKPYVRFGNAVPFEHTWVNVLWAATITAMARVKLHHFLTLQGPDIVYCDTDSVFSRAPIHGLSEGLGALSDPRTFERGWIVGPKLYSLESSDGTISAKAKGVPRERALAFLRGDEVIFDSPVSPRRARSGTAQAGEWTTIKRTRQLVPHRRVPINPAMLESGDGYSDTIPLYIGPTGL